jgi:hypothetical protein
MQVLLVRQVQHEQQLPPLLPLPVWVAAVL